MGTKVILKENETTSVYRCIEPKLCKSLDYRPNGNGNDAWKKIKSLTKDKLSLMFEGQPNKYYSQCETIKNDKGDAFAVDLKPNLYDKYDEDYFLHFE